MFSGKKQESMIALLVLFNYVMYCLYINTLKYKKGILSFQEHPNWAYNGVTWEKCRLDWTPVKFASP